MYKLKSIARRSTALGAAFAVLATAVIPAAPAFADALNPLTDRSLTLSSGAPGWDNTDGSGNATYAPPNSGANGQKTGNTFAFKVSTDSTADPVTKMTFQYCTTPAGGCMGPGDNGYSSGTPVGGDAVRETNVEGLANDPKTSDLEIVAPSASQIEQSVLSTYVNTTSGAVTSVPAATASGLNFIVMRKVAGTWTSSDGWTMTVQEAQLGDEADGESTAKDNQITLEKTGGQAFTAGQEVKVVFFGTNTNYITNPGSEEFFVRINTYENGGSVIDGGVTVANVMNQSIQITTKVLETMDFSVGTVDPYTLAATGSTGSQLHTANGNVVHGPCDPVLGSMSSADAVTEKNRLMLGSEIGEFSLETDDTYSTHSYWRLSSNSSAGATVYYSGVTLSNTVGDKINAIGATAAAPIVGSEQFGLALSNGTLADNPQPISSNPGSVHAVDYDVERDAVSGLQGGLFENGADNATNGIHASVTDNGISNLDDNASWHAPRLYPLLPLSNYDDGAGTVNLNYGAASDPISTKFAFDETSNQIPVAMATEDTEVVDCVTGKVRYIANIAATTPAGIYTTKVNYIAAPQY